MSECDCLLIDCAEKCIHSSFSCLHTLSKCFHCLTKQFPPKHLTVKVSPWTSPGLDDTPGLFWNRERRRYTDGPIRFESLARQDSALARLLDEAGPTTFALGGGAHSDSLPAHVNSPWCFLNVVQAYTEGRLTGDVSPRVTSIVPERNGRK